MRPLLLFLVALSSIACRPAESAAPSRSPSALPSAVPADAPPPPAGAPSASLECAVGDAGKLTLWARTPISTGEVRHEPVAGRYLLVWKGQTFEGEFSGTRNNDYGDLSVALAHVGKEDRWFSTTYAYRANESPVHASIALEPGSEPIAMKCAGALAPIRGD